MSKSLADKAREAFDSENSNPGLSVADLARVAFDGVGTPEASIADLAYSVTPVE